MLRADPCRGYDEVVRRLRRPGSPVLKAKSVNPPSSLIRLRKPIDLDWAFSFLANRALPPIETVTHDKDGWRYERRGAAARVTVRALPASLRIDVEGAVPDNVAERVRRLFALDVPPVNLPAHFAGDEYLGDIAKRHPGIGIPGAWDNFELAVRAVLGQQVSVERGRQLALKLIDRFGEGDFPTPSQLVHADVSSVGMPGRRGEAIRQLAALSLAGGFDFETQETAAVASSLLALPGFGPWTVAYIALRAGRDMDAFPHADWVVLKQLSVKARESLAIAERWRPYRGYGLMYLWRLSSESAQR